jgi:TorA maturation chaperone TorD
MNEVEGIGPYPAATPADERKMEDSSLVGRNELRAEMYGVLSVCFYPPEKSTLENKPILDLSETAFETLNIEAFEYLSRMREEFSVSPLEELLVEYARLFVGPFELIAPPYGSVYLDPKRIVMGDSTMKVLRAYKEAGLELSDSLREPPDHIAVELEFMHFLAVCETRATMEGNRGKARDLLTAQGRFLSESLHPWVPPFCEKIKQGAEKPFYRILADCLSAFVLKDAIDVNSVLNEARTVIRPG